jgi:putative ABC transport system substrate-binding protein
LSQKQSQEVQDAAREINLPTRIFWVGTAEIESVMDVIVREHIAALMVGADPFFDTRRDKLTGLALRHKLPTMFQFREYTQAGGLMSYGINLPDVYRQVGTYTARILKGENPADLSILQPSKFEFVVNLKAAKALGVQIPGKLLSFVDEVIE